MRSDSVIMKRTYGQTGNPQQQQQGQQPPQQQQQQPQYAYSAAPSGPPPLSSAPLPPGPPPPPPTIPPNPYAAYGYGSAAPPQHQQGGQQQQQQAPVNPYPAYGYGGAQQQAAAQQQYQAYAAPAQAYAQPPPPPPPQAGGAASYASYQQQQQQPPGAPNSYAAYGAAPPYAGAVAGASAPQHGQPPQAAYPYQPYPVQPVASYPQGPPPIQHQQPQGYPQAPPQHFGPPPPAPGMPSPQGAPPYKRTRYDQQPPSGGGGAQGQRGPPPLPSGPPPALPPLGGSGGYGASGGRGGGASGRGGFSGRGGAQGQSRGGGSMGGSGGGGRDGRDGFIGSEFGGSSFGGSPYSDRGGSGPIGGGGGGGGRGGRGDRNSSGSYNDRGGSSRGGDSYGGGRDRLPPPPPPYPRGGDRPPPNAPFGPSGSSSSRSGSGAGGGGSTRGGRSGPSGSGSFDRNRPVSGLPGSGSSSRGGASGRDFPSSSSASRPVDAPKGPKASRNQFASGGSSSANAQRKERKWGKDGSGSERKDESKGQLTDFRISGLAVPEIEWEWKAVEAGKSGEKDKKQKGKGKEAEKEEKENAKVEHKGDEEAKKGDEVQVEEAKPDLATAVESVVSAGEEKENNEQSLEDAAKDEERASSPAFPDMSVDTVAPEDLPLNDDAEIEEPSTDTAEEMAAPAAAPAKKKTKKQKKAEAAAKRAATLAASKDTDTGDSTAATADVTPSTTTMDEPAPKKSKHGRDDDEEDSAVAAEIAAKKAKADTGEIVKLENVATESTNGTAGLPAPPPPKRDLSLPAKPVTTLVPTGPAADSHHRPTPAPTNRENSRLRIYFSSPITGTSLPSSTPRGPSKKSASVKAATLSAKVGSAAPDSTSAPSVVVEEKVASAAEALAEDVDGEELAPSDGAVEVEQESKPEEETSAADVDVDGDDVDGEAVDDGQPVDLDGNTIFPDSEPAEGTIVSSDGDDAEEVQSVLVKAGVSVKDASEVVDAAVAAAEVKEEVPVAPADASIGTEELLTPAVDASTDQDEPPLLAGDDAAYPTIPYDQGTDADPSVADTETASQAPQPETERLPEPSADRISISYARNTRRLVIDAEVVDAVNIFRAEGRIEVSVALKPASMEGETASQDVFRFCRGVIIEGLDSEGDDYAPITRAAIEQASARSANANGDSDDQLFPPLDRILGEAIDGEGLSIAPGFTKSHITFVASLDRSNPLTEARWVKTGEVDAWITSLVPLGAGDSKKPIAYSQWKGKINVSDPDPPPTIQHALELGLELELGQSQGPHQFLFEILLRLTRGDRAGPSHYSASTQPSSVGALAASLSAPYAEHQTQVSLAVLAMFRLSVETAAKAGIPQKEVEKQVGEIVRGIPHHLIFKSLDGMFREQMRGKRA